jgi:hypothetical protein
MYFPHLDSGAAYLFDAALYVSGRAARAVHGGVLVQPIVAIVASQAQSLEKRDVTVPEFAQVGQKLLGF